MLTKKARFKLYLFYKDYETSFTTYTTHARWHHCSCDLRVGRKPGNSELSHIMGAYNHCIVCLYNSLRFEFMDVWLWTIYRVSVIAVGSCVLWRNTNIYICIYIVIRQGHTKYNYRNNIIIKFVDMSIFHDGLKRRKKEKTHWETHWRNC